MDNKNHIVIVAEIGCNHNGDKNIAKKMIDEALKCGVDAVKFQTFNSKELISKFAPKAEYQIKNTGKSESQLEMTEKLELSHSDYLFLKNYAHSKKIQIFSTPFDIESASFLQSVGQSVWKIPSGEITNLPLLEYIGLISCNNKKVYLSTGMANIGEIHSCLEVLLSKGMKPSEITILHCNTEYPTPDCDVNLLAINDLHREFPEYRIGFSDHSVGYTAAIGATVMGISLIEKHFTLDKNMSGPDHKASATPDELKQLVENVRRVEEMLGSGKKVITESEAKNRNVARKSIIARCEIKKGDIFTCENITCKRPGNGISPMEWHNVIGKKADMSFIEDEIISVQGIPFQENR